MAKIVLQYFLVPNRRCMTYFDSQKHWMTCYITEGKRDFTAAWLITNLVMKGYSCCCSDNKNVTNKKFHFELSSISSTGYRPFFVRFRSDQYLFGEVWRSTDWNVSSLLWAVELGGSGPFAQHVPEPRGTEKGDWSNWFYTGVVRSLLTSFTNQYRP